MPFKKWGHAFTPLWCFLIKRALPYHFNNAFQQMGQQLTRFTPVISHQIRALPYHRNRAFQTMVQQLTISPPFVFLHNMTSPITSQCLSNNGLTHLTPWRFLARHSRSYICGCTTMKSAYAQQVCLYATKVAYAQQVGHPISPWWCFLQFHVVYTPKMLMQKMGQPIFKFPIHGLYRAVL